MLEGKAAVRAVELNSCRNVRRSVAMRGEPLWSRRVTARRRLNSGCCSDVTAG
jgi:hypothetical protein